MTITVPCKRCGKQVPIEGCDVRQTIDHRFNIALAFLFGVMVGSVLVAALLWVSGQ